MPARANRTSDLAALTASNPVFDMDNVYLSDQGWVLRHYKNEAKTRYWDEIIVAGEVPASDSPAAFGAASPTFETTGGDTVQSPALTLDPVRIVPFTAIESTATVVDVQYDLDVADATFSWSTDEAGASFDDSALESPALSSSATPGTYTLTCVVSSATATDSPVTVTFDYEVVAA